jgi:hypothetical protein
MERMMANRPIATELQNKNILKGELGEAGACGKGMCCLHVGDGGAGWGARRPAGAFSCGA